MNRKVDHLAHLANVADFGGPPIEVVDVDQADIEIDVDVATRPAGIVRGKRARVRCLSELTPIRSCWPPSRE